MDIGMVASGPKKAGTWLSLGRSTFDLLSQEKTISSPDHE
jgi:hypothetical protein